LDFGKSLWAIESKLTASPSIGDINRLNKVAKLIKADRRVLVAKVQNPLKSEDLHVVDLPGLLKMLG